MTAIALIRASICLRTDGEGVLLVSETIHVLNIGQWGVERAVSDTCHTTEIARNGKKRAGTSSRNVRDTCPAGRGVRGVFFAMVPSVLKIYSDVLGKMVMSGTVRR